MIYKNIGWRKWNKYKQKQEQKIEKTNKNKIAKLQPTNSIGSIVNDYKRREV